MSYRGFIGVKLNNEFKIAQYFSFLSKDGLEEGINLISILKKFHTNNISLKSLVEKCEFVDDSYEDDNNPFFNDQLAAEIFLTLEKENSKCDKFLLKDSSDFLKEPLYLAFLKTGILVSQLNYFSLIVQILFKSPFSQYRVYLR